MAYGSAQFVFRLLIAVCTIFVVAPGVLSLISIAVLVSYGIEWEGSRGLLGVACLGLLTIPLAILQVIAIAIHSRAAAKLVSGICWCFLGIRCVGVANVVVFGTDDESPFRFVPGGVFLAALLGMNFLTALTMRQYARES